MYPTMTAPKRLISVHSQCWKRLAFSSKQFQWHCWSLLLFLNINMVLKFINKPLKLIKYLTSVINMWTDMSWKWARSNNKSENWQLIWTKSIILLFVVLARRKKIMSADHSQPSFHVNQNRHTQIMFMHWLWSPLFHIQYIHVCLYLYIHSSKCTTSVVMKPIKNSILKPLKDSN